MAYIPVLRMANGYRLHQRRNGGGDEIEVVKLIYIDIYDHIFKLIYNGDRDKGESRATDS